MKSPIKQHWPFLLLSITISIQSDAQTRWGIYGGPTISGVSVSTSGQFGVGTGSFFERRKTIADYFFGVTAEHKLGRTFVIRPSLLWTAKGWNVEEIFALTKIGYVETYRLSYFQLPLNLIYTTPIGSGKVYIGGGPYLAYALNGVFTNGLSTSNPRRPVYTDVVFQDESLSNFSRNDFYAYRLDYGISGTFGYETGFGMFINLAFDYGLRTVARAKGNVWSPDAKYRTYQFGVGYWLNRKKR